MALLNYLSQILLNLLRIADLVIIMTRAVASAVRLSEVLATPTTMPDPAAPELDAVPGAPAVAFEDVGFAYAGAGAPSLTGVTLAAAPGETIGVIGGTGSGKTTFVSLIPPLLRRHRRPGAAVRP